MSNEPITEPTDITLLTKKQIIILDKLNELNVFIDAEALWLSLRAEHQKIGRATIYRCLKQLHKVGFVEQYKNEGFHYFVYKTNQLSAKV